MPGKHVDISRVKSDFEDFLTEFGGPIYQRKFSGATSHAYYRGNLSYGSSAVTSFTGVWRTVTADDYRLIQLGRIEVGDAVAVVPSGTDYNMEDEWYLAGMDSDEYYNLTWQQKSLVGSAVIYHEVGLKRARGRR